MSGRLRRGSSFVTLGSTRAPFKLVCQLYFRTRMVGRNLKILNLVMLSDRLTEILASRAIFARLIRVTPAVVELALLFVCLLQPVYEVLNLLFRPLFLIHTGNGPLPLLPGSAALLLSSGSHLVFFLHVPVELSQLEQFTLRRMDPTQRGVK